MSRVRDPPYKHSHALSARAVAAGEKDVKKGKFRA
jgi:hypothetical protein